MVAAVHSRVDIAKRSQAWLSGGFVGSMSKHADVQTETHHITMTSATLPTQPHSIISTPLHPLSLLAFQSHAPKQTDLFSLVHCRL